MASPWWEQFVPAGVCVDSVNKVPITFSGNPTNVHCDQQCLPNIVVT